MKKLYETSGNIEKVKNRMFDDNSRKKKLP